MRLAVIPARGGSKRIPRKNIKVFCGRPIIAWSIEAAASSGCFDRIIVSTDDEEVAEVARACGAEVPFLRPPELSDDITGTIPVVAHAIRWQRQSSVAAKYVCCIYATAPFIDVSDLRSGYEVLVQSQSDYAFAITKFASPIQRAIRITRDNRIEMFHPEQFNSRSQDLEEAFHDAGQFYWGRADAWLAETPVFSAAATPVVLPRYRVQDIDTPDDWIRAEIMFRAIDQATSLADREKS